MKKIFYLFALLPVAALVWSIAPAVAVAAAVAGDGQVTIPWGDWLASSADTLVTLAASVLALALARLPASIVSMLRTWQVDQLLERAIGYGINAVAGAAKGQTLSVPIANKVAEQALEYAIENGSAALIKWMGGAETIKKKVVARLDIAPEAGFHVK